MHSISNYPTKITKYFGSIWSPEYQKQLITNESAKHDWDIIVAPNEATIIAKNNHKFDIQFTPGLEHLSCSCSRFVDDGLNWCQHLAAFKRFIDLNYKIFCSHKHIKKPKLLFYNSLSEILYSPYENKVVNPKDIPSYEGMFSSSIKNLKNVPELIGLSPSITNPFTEITTYPYQDKAIRHMLHYKRTILSLEMGWGKTLCALICSKHILDLNPNAKILIICPKSLKLQWEKEIKKFLPEFSVQNLKDSKSLLNYSNFTIVNYETTRTYGFNNFYDIVILDEVQKIKNKHTQAWKAISKIKSEWYWALSGTVVENNVEDFLSIADILRPELFKVRWKFYDKFCEVDKNIIKGFKNSEEMTNLLESIIYRAPDGETPLSLTLKERTHTVNMTPNQKKIHDRYYQEVKRILAISMTRPLYFYEKNQLSAYQTRARQASDAIQLIDLNSTEKSNKIDEIINLVEKTEGKVVLFSEWKEFLILLESRFKAKKITSVKFDGSLSQVQRKKCLNQFIEDPDIKVFLSSDSGGVGVDGLQKVSNTIIHAQMTWNPARLQQRNGRLFRIGQKNEVNSYLFLSKDSIEESIIKTHSRKNNVKDVIFGNK
jgi:SNF2 family DNA or RNA helicase